MNTVHKLPKSKMQQIHAKQRAMERYGLAFNKAARKHFVSSIHNGVAEFISATSNRAKLYCVPYKEALYYIVFDHKRNNVVTFLKPEWVTA